VKIRIGLEVEVDDEGWARDYGLEPGEVSEDVLDHVPELVTEAATEKARLLGTFRVTNLGTLLVHPDGALSRAR
jgi:hypothetical protein